MEYCIVPKYATGESCDQCYYLAYGGWILRSETMWQYLRKKKSQKAKKQTKKTLFLFYSKLSLSRNTFADINVLWDLYSQQECRIQWHISVNYWANSYLSREFFTFWSTIFCYWDGAESLIWRVHTRLPPNFIEKKSKVQFMNESLVNPTTDTEIWIVLQSPDFITSTSSCCCRQLRNELAKRSSF